MTKWVTTCSWSEVPHLSEETKADLIRSYPVQERDARTRGVPQLGSGAIYPIPESEVVVDPFEIPPHFRRSYGLDVGWNRTAAIWSAHDSETDTLYLYSEYYRGNEEPAIHAQGIRARGEWIPGVIDPAARGRSQHDGQQLLASYRDLGLNLTIADNGVESGIFEVYRRLSEGRLKVFRTLMNWRQEYRTYQRDKKGAIMKRADHLMDATRYDVRSGIEIAVFAPVKDWNMGRPKSLHAAEFDPFAEASKTSGHRVEHDAFREATSW